MTVEGFLFGAAYLVAVNLLAVLAFALDKYRAVHGEWRIPERTLLTIAAAGGTIGAIVASERLRHKTHKEPFRTYLRMILAIQVVALIGATAIAAWQRFGPAIPT